MILLADTVEFNVERNNAVKTESNSGRNEFHPSVKRDEIGNRPKMSENIRLLDKDVSLTEFRLERKFIIADSSRREQNDALFSRLHRHFIYIS